MHAVCMISNTTAIAEVITYKATISAEEKRPADGASVVSLVLKGSQALKVLSELSMKGWNPRIHLMLSSYAPIISAEGG